MSIRILQILHQISHRAVLEQLQAELIAMPLQCGEKPMW